MNENLICTTCGTQYGLAMTGDKVCPICSDDRQYTPETGQSWTTLSKISQGHSLLTKKLNSQLYEIKIVPTFAIGQRALLVLTPAGNILWDCVSLINEPIVEFIKSKGGLQAIAISHPHYFSIMNEWAGTFDCPIYIHASDEQWIFNKGEHVSLWEGAEINLWDDIKIINIGGHFPGSSVLHVPGLSAKGTILCGDTFYISPSLKHMAPMYSYPNKIPLPIEEVRRIKEHMNQIEFDSLLGFYDFQNVYGNAKQILYDSLNKYV
jgi:hypothetical protein